MKQKTYNGWTNYETWNVALWIDNEPGTQETALEMTREAINGTGDDDSREERIAEACGALSNNLKNWIEEMTPDLGASMFADLLGAALSEVEWYEIAEHYVSDEYDNVVSE